MRRTDVALAVLVLALVSVEPFHAQSSQPSASVTVPRLISVSGVFRPADGEPPGAVEEVTLSIYAEQTGGSPLWQETQTIQPDATGRYSVLLGATAADGVPVGVFASGHPLWLGIAFARPGEAEEPRTRIASVPYALRASDAETLGGLPASAYVLAPTADDETHETATRTSGNGDVSMMTADTVLPGTQNFLAKYVNGQDVGASALFELGSSVGIGTTAPFDALHVRFTNTGGSATGIALQNLGNTSSSYSGLLFYDHTGVLTQFQGFNNVTHEYRINNIARDVSGPFQFFNGSINFMIGGTSRFFANMQGVGIGTTSPATNLEVSNAATPFAVTNVYATAYNGTAPTFQGRSARGTPAAPTAVQNGDMLAFFSGGGYAQTFFATSKAAIAMRATENWTNTAQGTAIGFMTTMNGTNVTVERMTIDSTGNVGIGTTSPLDTLQVVGDIRIGTSGTNGCVKNFGGGIIMGMCASDARFKKDVTPFGPALAALTALRPVHYSWRTSEFRERHFGESRAYGLIAQEVEQVLPELVTTDDDGYKAVDYSKLPLLTIQAIKELKEESDVLEARLAELERLVNDLRSAALRR